MINGTRASVTTEYRAYHWGTAKSGWIPLAGLNRPTFGECREAVLKHLAEWHDGPFEIRESVTTEITVSTLT